MTFLPIQTLLDISLLADNPDSRMAKSAAVDVANFCATYSSKSPEKPGSPGQEGQDGVCAGDRSMEETNLREVRGKFLYLNQHTRGFTGDEPPMIFTFTSPQSALCQISDGIWPSLVKENKTWL